MNSFCSLLDLYHNKSKGLFNLLNDECSLKIPSVQNFTNKLANEWNQGGRASPISWEIPGEKSRNVFLIRHFMNNVVYSMVNQMYFIGP